MWELNHKESWVLKNWCFWTVVLEKTLESPLDCKEIQPVHPKDQSWVFIGRTDVEAEALILWQPDAKSQLSGKDPDAGKNWRQKEKGWQRITWLVSTTDSMDMNLSKLWEIVKDREAWHAVVHGLRRVRHDQATDCATTNVLFIYLQTIFAEIQVAIVKNNFRSYPCLL